MNYVQGKFSTRFGSLTLPTPVIQTEKYQFKSILWMWILQYGSYFAGSQELTYLIAVFNSAVEWDKLLCGTSTTSYCIYKGARHLPGLRNSISFCPGAPQLL